MKIEIDFKEMPASIAFLQLCQQWDLIFSFSSFPNDFGINDYMTTRITNKNNTNFQEEYCLHFSSQYDPDYAYMLNALIAIKYNISDPRHSILFDKNNKMQKKFKEQKITSTTIAVKYHDNNDLSELYNWKCPCCKESIK